MSGIDLGFDLSTYLACVTGILISVLLPPMWAVVTERFKPANPGAKGLGGAAAAGWALFRPYLALGVASALTALLLLAFLGGKIESASAAMLAGYAWDSTLQKLGRPGPQT